MKNKIIISSTLYTIIAMAAPQTGHAQSYFCDRPRKPSIPYYGLDEYSSPLFISEIERYERKMKEYLSCLKSESDDSAQEYNRFIKDINLFMQTRRIR